MSTDRDLHTTTWKQFIAEYLLCRAVMREGNMDDYRHHRRRARDLGVLIKVLNDQPFGNLTDGDFSWLAQRRRI